MFPEGRPLQAAHRVRYRCAVIGLDSRSRGYYSLL